MRASQRLPCSVAYPLRDGGGRAQALQEVREGVPVVKHEVAHAQEGELLQAPRARVQAQRALRDAVKGALVVPLQRVLAAQGDACCRGRLNDLLQQPCRPKILARKLVSYTDMRQGRTSSINTSQTCCMPDSLGAKLAPTQHSAPPHC